MTTSPTVPTIADFHLIIWSLTDETKIHLHQHQFTDLEFTTTEGVDQERLHELSFRTAPNLDNPIDLTQLQAVQLIAYGDVHYWGLIDHPAYSYDPEPDKNGAYIHATGIEELLSCRQAYHNNAGSIEPLSFTNAYADDLAKELLRKTALSGTCTADIDGRSRDWDWGTLVVEADASGSVDQITASYLHSGKRTILDEITYLSQRHGFVYQLAVSETAGALTFTFKTKGLRGGSDLTSGDDRVQIKDIADLLPRGKRYARYTRRATIAHTRAFRATAIDATSLSAYGRWETSTTSTQAAHAATLAEASRPTIGTTTEFTATGANGMVLWLQHYKAGDLVNRANTQLDQSATTDVIEYVHGHFVNGRLQLAITWQDLEDRIPASDRGGGSDPDETDGRYVTPNITFGVTADEGTASTKIRSDARIPLYFRVGETDMWPDEDENNRFTYIAGTAVTLTGADHALTIAHATDASAIPTAHHALVTLTATLNTNLLSISTQQLDLDTQAANRIFAGPTTGGAATPTFRALVEADIPDLSGTYSVVGHDHDADYAAIDHDHDADYAAIGHNHDHGALTGKGDDDHTQYVLADGSRPLSNDWDVGTHQLRASTLYADGGYIYIANTSTYIRRAAAQTQIQTDLTYLTLAPGSTRTINIRTTDMYPNSTTVNLGHASYRWQIIYGQAGNFSTTLAVTGATTLSSTLAVTGATTLSSTLAVTGAATLSSTLAVTGNTTIGGTLIVTGLATFSAINVGGLCQCDSFRIDALPGTYGDETLTHCLAISVNGTTYRLPMYVP